MTTSPLISVVMAVYNGAATLPATLDSILTQEGVDLEFIVVNDGSTDSSGQILLEYAAKDQRLHIVEQANKGITCSLIRGCSEARGEYIARQDVGDISLPGRMVQQRAVLAAHPHCSFVACHTEFCGPQWELMWMSKGSPDAQQPVSILPDSPQTGLTGDIPHHGSVMFRRTGYRQAGGYRCQFYYGQDWDLWYRLAEQGTYGVVSETLYRARIFPQGISMVAKKAQDVSAACSLGAFIARQTNLDEQPWLDRAQQAGGGRYQLQPGGKLCQSLEPGLYFIGEALRRRKNRGCRNYFYQAIRNDPFKVRSYVRLLQSIGCKKNNFVNEVKHI